MNASIFSRLTPEEITALHETWKNDPLSVDPLWAAYFEGYELGSGGAPREEENAADASPYTVPPESAEGRGRVNQLIRAYRVMGHKCARFNPLDSPEEATVPVRPEELGFRPEDMDQPINIGTFQKGRIFTLREIIAHLRNTYCGAIGFEYQHIDNLEIRSWIEEKIDRRADGVDYGPETRRDAFIHLCKAELFEEFLGKRFIGEKRFSLEGGEGAIVLLDALVKRCPAAAISHVEMGMAHRGRLNVLANILHKPLKTIFYEFTPDYLPESPIGRSDVKYHLGYAATRHVDGVPLHINLSSNPSHLEAVYPVVEGRARARQHSLDDMERKHVLPLILHGDAAFAGQGLVAEVLNLSQLKGYRTGGSIHLIINNQIGFTTSPDEARSSHYATDVAQMLEAPILHINGESPENLIWAAEFALQFRQKFGRDIILDMYCYRRLGHNETDQAAFTAPMQTKKIEARPTAAALYGTLLRERGELTEQEEHGIRERIWNGMQQAYDQMKEHPADYILPVSAPDADESPIPRLSVRTGISPDLFRRIGDILTELPENFTPHPTLEKRFLSRRREAFREDGPLDWAMAESLAWGSLLTENHTVRLSGQDCQRGTFSQRHAVLHDFNNGSVYTPLEKLNHGTTAFRIYNSSLSEASVLGFEYGYALESQDALVMWEAQFGDFANGAQVIVDQFIAAAEAKWHQKCRIVLLLPHGYEGAGSEHSSARMERYLQLCADDNMQVINPTTPAQYFHALRRQIHQNVHKPLIVFTPKSLLSRPEAASARREFLAPSRFHEVLASAREKSTTTWTPTERNTASRTPSSSAWSKSTRWRRNSLPTCSPPTRKCATSCGARRNPPTWGRGAICATGWAASSPPRSAMRDAPPWPARRKGPRPCTPPRKNDSSPRPSARAPNPDHHHPMSDILIPSFGESITAATVAAWHKGSGDAVARGDTLVTLETDKVSTDLEADEDGMLEILVPEGAEAPIGAVLGRIAPSAGTSVPEKEEATVLPEPENTPQPDVKKAASPPEELPEQAHEPSETLREKQSAGPEQAAPRFIRKPMSPLRRTIAARLAQVQHQAAILTTFNECDMSAVMELRRQFNASFRERYGTKLGLMGFFIKAAVKALKEVPQVNAKIDGTDIVENLYYDISVAIGTDKGLMVPVLRDCDRKTLPELELELAALAEKARKGALSMQDLQGGCFTISNGGTYGSLLSTPILNPPQSGILGMHAIQERPVVRDGQITIRPMMYLALSYDHRLVDGKQAVQFLIAVKNAVENPVFEL